MNSGVTNCRVWKDAYGYRWARPYTKQDEYIGLFSPTYGRASTKEEAIVACQQAEVAQREWRQLHEAT